MEDKKEQKKYINKKVVTAVIAVILFVLILVISLITMASTIKASNLAFGRYRFYIMKSESQPEIAVKGDLVIAKKLKSGEIQPGDKIVYGDGKFYYCDNIEQTRRINTITKMITAQREGIKYQFSEDEVEGKIICTIHELGDIISFLRTPVGMVFFIIFVVCVFLLMRIIFIGKKKDKDEESDEDDENAQDEIEDEKLKLDNENSIKKTTKTIAQKEK